MGSERRDRFLKVERARPGRSDASDPLPEDGRFAEMGSTDRIRPPAERGLDTDDGRSGQPFIRCADCKVDSSVYEVRCQRCGADLNTPAQRSFNERLWAEHRSQDEAASREIAERERTRNAEAAEVARQRREIGEELARRERERVLDQFPEGPVGTGSFGRADTVGMRLLRHLPGTAWRVVAALVVFGIPLLLLLFSRGLPQLVGMIFLAAVVLLFSPRRGRDRRW